VAGASFVSCLDARGAASAARRHHSSAHTVVARALTQFSACALCCGCVPDGLNAEREHITAAVRPDLFICLFLAAEKPLFEDMTN
jgi:hypothetical protein